MTARNLLNRTLGKLMRSHVQLAAFTALSAVCLLATVALTLQVFFQLDAYGSADRDNVEWSMAQLEVDQVKLILAVEDADPPEIRRRFDVFYSRVETLRNGRVYREELTGTRAEIDLRQIRAALDRMIPMIDAPDPVLRDATPRIGRTLDALTQPIRNLSSRGISIDAARTDAERDTLTSKMVQLATLNLVLLAALLSLLLLLQRLYHVHRDRAKENRTTLDRLAAILNTSRDAILVTETDGRIVDANAVAHRMFGGPDARLDGMRRISDLLGRPAAGGGWTPLTPDGIVKAGPQSPAHRSDLKGRRADGTEFPVELSADLSSRDGRDVCVCFIRDISRRVAVEAEIRDAREKALSGVRAKARFLGMISHEMRTPLNGLLGALDLIEDTGLRPEQARYARIMKSSGQLLVTQIEDALDIAQADRRDLSVTPGSFDLGALVYALIEGQRPEAAANGTEIDLLGLDTAEGRVDGDRDRLHQVLLNLLSNAVKFTRNGHITIEVVRLRSADGPTGDVEIRIADTGIGISDADLPTIFDDFVRVDDPGRPSTEGTGLGLGIARHLVELMGGRIGAESVKGEGSLFWIVLPLPPSAAAAIAPPAPGNKTPAAAPCPACSVLIVEDNGTNREVLHAMLEKDGHDVALAADGAQGVNLAGARHFDLILMDLSMPVMDGIEATRRIRGTGGPCAKTRVIGLTAHFRPDDDARLSGAGFDDIQAKPLRRSRLADLLSGGAASCRPAVCVDGALAGDVLDQLHADLPEEKVRALMTEFLDDGHALMAELATLDPALPGDLGGRLHRLAGSAATLGAVALQSALA
ncbi:ATP-binding protein, partial [Roseovarius sp. SYSU LYC5161]|uniref:hybrid sensor histidine kinase/response regulator n=1 Tax=Roseovarius halophilus (ex Wu et al. 2025) TaxID=3376060 RepID=UPI00399BEEB2